MVLGGADGGSVRPFRRVRGGRGFGRGRGRRFARRSGRRATAVGEVGFGAARMHGDTLGLPQTGHDGSAGRSSDWVEPSSRLNKRVEVKSAAVERRRISFSVSAACITPSRPTVGAKTGPPSQFAAVSKLAAFRPDHRQCRQPGWCGPKTFSSPSKRYTAADTSGTPAKRQASCRRKRVAKLSVQSSTTVRPVTSARTLAAVTSHGCASTFTSGFCARSRAAAMVAFAAPMSSAVNKICRCKFETSTLPASASVSRPTPEVARYSAAGQPSPPTPTTSTLAAASAAPVPIATHLGQRGLARVIILRREPAGSGLGRAVNPLRGAAGVMLLFPDR